MKTVLNINSALFAVALATSTVASGCANTARRMDTVTSEIRDVEELGTAGVPQALVHMQLAKEQMKRAERMAAVEKWKQAESMIRRAQADATLALLLLQEEAEKTETMAAVKRGRLREQNDVPVEEDKPSDERNSP